MRKMKNNKDKWVDEVINSMQDSQKAQPAPELFAKIEAKIGQPYKKNILINRWRVAAAILLLVLNGLALRQINQNNRNNEVVITQEPSIISNYNIYKK